MSSHRALCAVALLALAGCSSVTLPLCPSIADRSYVPPEADRHINRFALERSNALGIQHVTLSPFVAKYTGSAAAVDMLRAEYPFLLCAFEPRQELKDRETYMSCIRHAPQWIASIQSDAPERLMLAEYLFKENCAY